MKNVNVSKKQTKKLINAISDYAPDIVHLHNLHGHYINYEELFYARDIYLDQEIMNTERFVH